MNNKIKVLLAFLGVVSLAALGIAAWIYFYAQTEIDGYASKEQQLLQENQLLEKQIAQLQGKVDSVQKEAMQWQQKIQAVNAALEQAKGENALLSGQYETLLQERSALLEKNRILAMQIENIDQLYGQTPQTSQVESSDTFLAALLEEKATLQVELENLKEKLSDQEKKIAELQLQARPFEELQEQKLTLQRQLEDSQRIADILSSDLLTERKRRVAMEEELAIKSASIPASYPESSLISTQAASAQEPVKQLASIQLPPIVVKAEGQKAQAQDVYLPRLSQSRRVEIEQPQGVTALEAQTDVIPEGRIITINDKHKFVVINIGGDDGVEKGMAFNVYRNERKVGEVEVIELRKNISACDIKGLNVSSLKINDVIRR